MNARVSMLDIARAAWGAALPDWVQALATECDRTGSLARGGRGTGYSTGTISLILNNKYRGAVTNVEAAVRGALMAAEVECPILGTINAATCMSNQRAGLNTTGPQAVRLYRACRSCPNKREVPDAE